jgi:signal transduction histidine kinase
MFDPGFGVVHATRTGLSGIRRYAEPMRPALSPARWSRATTIDVLVAAVVAFPTFMDSWWNQPGTRQADWITFALAGLSIAALLVRRRWPLGVALVCAAALTTWFVLDHRGELLNLPTMVALYTVAVQGDRRTTTVVAVAAAAWFGTLAYLVGDPVGSPVMEMLWPLVPLLFGEAVRARHELREEYAAHARRAEADREVAARRHVEEERLRIAREMHDVVAHTMAAVNVQMGVAVAAFDARPDMARAALDQAQISSRAALRELRGAISLLRGGGDADGTRPAPQLCEIEDLAVTTRRAGVAVTVRDGTVGHDVPAAVQLAAYRIVQEALTNVRKHAHASRATVVISYDPDELGIEVLDDGVGTCGNGRLGAGHGLVGMRERAALYGGTVETGPGPHGGFRVTARIPCLRETG